MKEQTDPARWALYTALLLLPVLLAFFSLFIGRYPLGLEQVIRILREGFAAAQNSIPRTIVWELRLPRALLAVIVGGALAVSGGTLQGVFRSPLVNAGMLGVSSGAGFGACLAILSFGSIGFSTYILSFAFGLLAVCLSVLVSRVYNNAPTIMLILGGIIISSIFSALISFLKYVADPYEQLPAITFWLMGSLARASYGDITLACFPIGIGLAGIFALRWRVNLLSIGEKEARSMGVDTRKVRAILIACTALLTAGAVCLCGTIGWIGLIIPHIGRMLVGNDNRVLLPVSFLLGSAFLLLVDMLARTISADEIPIGILISLVGAPFYIYLIGRVKGGNVW